MKTVTTITLSLLLGCTCTSPVAEAEQAVDQGAVKAETASSPSDEIHFETVLTTKGEIVSVDRTNNLVTLKKPSGNTVTLQARNEKNLENISKGDRVVIRYVEGIQIRKKGVSEALPVATLQEGIVGVWPRQTPKAEASRRLTIVASVEAVDVADQEVTLKGPDGSVETVMVENPESLKGIKVGDQIVITRSEALALSLDKEN
jgi:hypothetical protein